MFRFDHFENKHLEALEQYFHTWKWPSNVSLQIQLNG